MDIRDEVPKEHEDLEERFQISADVFFESATENFEGLKPFEVDIKKKKDSVKKVKVENIELRKKQSNRGSLF